MSTHYPNAACRHVLDSKTLLDEERWDGCAYIAGYAIECSLKAVISHPECPSDVDLVAIGHDLSTLAHRLDQMASSRKSGRKRNVCAGTLTALRGSLKSQSPTWGPSMRYEGQNPLWEAKARAWWSLANRCFQNLAQNLVTEAAT
jgi:hypothetical protein